ncbi:MAG: type III polyketide synthase [Sporocytophaga sp.]|uniref:type III polyketide synthase n=1 Tax=Sporocytophaga sp. TaxID=2231183 RepID=UPI001AFF2CB4|nr:type III polyketide synthase [Sporocytophaga sp.]MBO9701487.1 type III polyketide synthase [Sporocytophaga sp.]
MKSFITAIGTANPAYGFPQLKIAEFMSDAVSMNEEERQRLFTLYRASGIRHRYSVLPDFGTAFKYSDFFKPGDKALMPSVSERMALYKQEALPLSIAAIENCLDQLGSFSKDKITHLITVSCTGMYAPGLDLDIVQSLGLSHSVNRTCVNFMGCYAAFSGMKVADAICKADKNAVVLMVCVELCTIHYQKSMNWDHILSNAIFGDGAAAVIVQAEKSSALALSPELFYCDLLPEGRKDMAWSIADFGFEMTLSSYVPSMIKSGIKELTNNLLSKLSYKVDEIDYFAVHPGGKKILEVIKDELEIKKEKCQQSFDVLADYGNMSSPSVLFVLKKIMQDLQNDLSSKRILSFAFGPGLTMESMVLEVVPSEFTKALEDDKEFINIEAV